jgi:flagellar biosynthesis protein FlhG
MTTVYAIGGGKGGVGKSVVSIIVSRAFAIDGKSTILIDADLGGSNLHTLLGMDYPRMGISDFLINNVGSLEGIKVVTEDRNIQLIGGAGEVLGMTNLKASVKEKLIRHIHKLNADRVVMDLGAGSSLNTLDFFLSASKHIVVVSPEPTSLQNAYEFLKLCVERILYTRFSKDDSVADYIKRFLTPNIKNAITSFPELLNQIAIHNEDKSKEIMWAVKDFRPYVILNMIENQSEAIKYYSTLETVTKRYLKIRISHLVTIHWRKDIANAIKQRKSLLSLKLGANNYSLMKTIAKLSASSV